MLYIVAIVCVNVKTLRCRTYTHITINMYVKRSSYSGPLLNIKYNNNWLRLSFRIENLFKCVCVCIALYLHGKPEPRLLHNLRQTNQRSHMIRCVCVCELNPNFSCFCVCWC